MPTNFERAKQVLDRRRETAEREACAMEHGISEDSFRKLAARYPLALS